MVREACQSIDDGRGVPTMSPQVIYDFASETTGGSGCEQRTLKLAINKEVGYEQCGVLVPNSYFGGGHGNLTMWASEVRGQDSKLEPFSARKGKAMYRGVITSRPGKCVQYGEDV